MNDRILLVSLKEALPLKERLFTLLDGTSKAKALRYVQEKDQVRSALGSLLIRAYVGDGVIQRGKRGKPFVEDGPEFNLSHAGDYVGIFISDEPVGLDIEEIDRCQLDIVRGAFTKEETTGILTQEDFALAWTRKESVTKCLGKGIEEPTKYGLIKEEKDQYCYQGRSYHVVSVAIDGHIITGAKEGKGAIPMPQRIYVPNLWTI